VIVLQHGYLANGGAADGPVRAHQRGGGVRASGSRDGVVSGPKVLVGEDRRKVGRALTPSPEMAWRVAGVVGLLFALVGWLDVALTWYPFHLGSAEWEFGTVTASLNGLPVPVLGMGLLLASGMALGRPWLVRLVALWFVVTAVALAVMAVLYVTNVPIALKTVEEPALRTGLKKAIVKALGQSVIYPIVLLSVAVKSWRHARAG